MLEQHRKDAKLLVLALKTNLFRVFSMFGNVTNRFVAEVSRTRHFFLKGICDVRSYFQSATRHPRPHWNLCFLHAKVNFIWKPQLNLWVKHSHALIWNEAAACFNISPSGKGTNSLPKCFKKLSAEPLDCTLSLAVVGCSPAAPWSWEVPSCTPRGRIVSWVMNVCSTTWKTEYPPPLF